MKISTTSPFFSTLYKTLAYSDIFDYPLTADEVAHYLISNTEVKVEVIRESLKILTECKRIYTDGEYYFLRGRKITVKIRKEKEKWSKEKWKIAQKTADKLKIFPSIKMIGVTGALAMNNCKKEDDIDLFIITSQNSLWLTRLLLILCSPFFRIKRRKPNDVEINNKICFNLFLDESDLKIRSENLFNAHEIVQVKPIFDRGGIYEKFINGNKWVKKYLPNAITVNNSTIQQFNNRSFVAKLLNCFIALLNRFVYLLQFWYMKPKITNEKVSLTQVFFHPKIYSNEIEKKYKQNLKQVGLDNSRI